MPPEPGRRLSIALHDGGFDRVHYALVLASAALAINRPATLFVSGRAVHAFTGTADRPGWAALDGAALRDAELRARRVAGFEELLSACRELGLRLIVCEMALRAEAVEAGALRQDLAIETAGVVTLLNEADGQIVFV